MNQINGQDFVELKKVGKHFKLASGLVKAIDDISLSINKEEVVALVGPSGSGKTTLLNIIGSLDRPTSGEVLIEGERIDQLSEEKLVRFRREKFSFIFQEAKPLRMLNVLENTILPFIFFKPKDKSMNIKEEGKTIIKSLGLGHRLYHMPNQLSGGENQRLSIARALITHPEMILADEPTANLDRENRLFVIDTFRKLTKEKGITILYATHDIEMADCADRVISLKDGLLENVK
jgi:putative ABC transport system ATP-binding protein